MDKRAFWARVWPKLARSPLVVDGDRVLAAVSGGPDSVCLGHWLALRSRKIRLGVAIAHVHHGLRGREADADEAFVRGLAKDWGVPFYARRVKAAEFARKEGRSLEDAARKLRYAALAKLAGSLGYSKVAVAHHADDQAETVLLHVLRGTEPKGLAGMPERRALGRSVELVRPLLSLTRDDVLAYLEFHRLPFRNDRTNRDLDRTRNWVRHKLLPLLRKKNPRIREHLVELARNFSSSARQDSRYR